jgi:DnaJ homolog subfamily C member 19
LILWVLIGGLVLFLLMGGMRAFEQANVRSLRSLSAWVLTLGGLSMALMLILTGRGLIALGLLVLLWPVLWDRFQASGGIARFPLPRLRR